MSVVPPERVYQRVLHWADRDAVTGCLVSRYSVASHGYAQVGWIEAGVRTVTLCHLVVWRFTEGLVPKGMTVDHTCHNRRCAERSHLRLLTNLQNARRNGPGDWALDGSCKHGHDEKFWKPKEDGVRTKGYCSECRKRYYRPH